jgi:hypothetical protein
MWRLTAMRAYLAHLLDPGSANRGGKPRSYTSNAMPMKLPEFIVATLQQIAKGVEDAQSSLPSVVPMPPTLNRDDGSNPTADRYLSADGMLVQNVKFDVAISTLGRTELSGSGKVNADVYVVGGIEATGGVTQSFQGEKSNRVQFEVPLGLRLKA